MMTFHRSAIIACMMAFVLAGVASAADQPDARPNIVFLLADQWRASATGYAGDPNVKTPNLDRLAGQGLNFRNTVSVCPVCTPYRAALMTGRFPTSTGMFLNDASLPASELCMADIFKSAGYNTAYIGKWHLDGHGRQAYIPPERRRGWDYWKAAECDHEYNHSHYYEGTSPQKKFWEGYDAYAQTADAQQYIRSQAKAGKPFILFVAYGGPHFPHKTAPIDYQKLYEPDQIKLPPNVPQELAARARAEAQGYYAHCTAIDKCIGDVMATLAEAGIDRNTILVFTADHGEMLGSHGIRPTTKHFPWDESAHVPFLLRYPAAQGSARAIAMPLTTPDILPTLLSLCSVTLPKTLDGHDMSSVVRGGAELSDYAALYMAVAPFAGHVGAPAEPYRAIRTARYTYVRNLQGPWLMFDDQADPHQMHNLVAEPASQDVRKDLEGRLQAEMSRIHDNFRPAQEHIDEWGYHVRAGQSVPYGPAEKEVQSPHRN